MLAIHLKKGKVIYNILCLLHKPIKSILLYTTHEMDITKFRCIMNASAGLGTEMKCRYIYMKK